MRQLGIPTSGRLLIFNWHCSRATGPIATGACQPYQICIKSLSHTHTHLGELMLWQGTSRLWPRSSWLRSTMPQGAMPILTTRPVRCCPSKSSASPTCLVTPESSQKKTKIYSYNGSKSGPKQWPKVNKFPTSPPQHHTKYLDFDFHFSFACFSFWSFFFYALSLYSILYYTSCAGQCGRMCLKFNNRPSTKQRRQKGQTLVKKKLVWHENELEIH